jgi:hypothetical protein
MNHRLFVVIMISWATLLSGCTGTGAYNHQGLFSNADATRIAPPATGMVQYPQQQAANLVDPYYAPSPATTAGWRPAGSAVPSTASLTGTPSAADLQAGFNTSTAASNNLVVASSTSAMPTGGGTILASNPAQPPVLETGSLSGGALPVNDATRVATAPVQTSNTGILNRTWEYVARPNAPMYPPGSTIQQPVYATGSVAASPSTPPGYAAPRPSSYAYPAGYPAQPGYQYPNTSGGNNAMAEGWQQREVPR